MEGGRGEITTYGWGEITTTNKNIKKNNINKEISEQELFDFLNGSTKSDKLPELPF
jgi:hypothetical protein